jgi:CDP-diacylglycerol--serine O-phosphatidyltransferase
MLFGFFAIIYSLQGDFGYASAAIMLAMILDLFDGRVARMIKKPSPLGKHLDSFADIVTFCISPAVLFYSVVWGAHGLIYADNAMYFNLRGFFIFEFKIIGVFLSFIFPLAGSIRIARFMEKKISDNENKREKFFIGMPSTFAGGSVALFTGFNFLSSPAKSLLSEYLPWLVKLKIPLSVIFILYFFYAFIMISNFNFFKASPDLLNFRKDTSVIRIILNVLFIFAIIFFMKYFLVIGALYYVFWSLIKYQKKEYKTDV